MPEPINVGSGRGAGWLHDAATTRLVNLFSNTVTLGSFAMFDSATNAAYVVPAGRKLTILSVNYIGVSGNGAFYIQSYSGGVFVGTKLRMYSTDTRHPVVETALEFSAGQQVYTQQVGDCYCNCFGVESTV
tara:strand:+ start:210 stop:602 length:393 start_codon:yes stop_codon:yes gene_type:complete